MLRRRAFQLRGRNVELRELTDLIAIRSSQSALENLFNSDRESISRPHSSGLSRRMLDVLAPDVSLEQVRAFEASGWVFVPKAAVPNLSEDTLEAKVFIKPGGLLALSTNQLIVRLYDDPDEAEAKAILQPFGCQILEKLSFARGLFRVEAKSLEQSDAIDVANQIIASGVAEFAEPELIEVLGER